ncbi:MAG TPA: hypothetical protein ENG87_05945 [Candidatus Pacearchaeota archaeon]|nr:hypothetical protein [Candidatus Pacearchaeota archaeon]
MFSEINDQPVSTDTKNSGGFLKSLTDFAGGLLPLAKQYYQIRENKKTRQIIEERQRQQTQLIRQQQQLQLQQSRQPMITPSPILSSGQIPWNLVAMGSGILLITMLLLRRKRSRK